jgi:hypothetical protein
MRAIAHAVLVVALGACGSAPHRTRSLSAIDARYLAGELSHGAPDVAATRLYRGVLGKSLGARCRMFPTDSQLFDRRAARCGSATAAVLGIARLFLETAGAGDVMPSLVVEGRLRWLDLPSPDECAP